MQAGLNEMRATLDSTTIWQQHFDAQTADFKAVIDVLLTFLEFEEDPNFDIDGDLFVEEQLCINQEHQQNQHYVSGQQVGVAEKYQCTMGA